MNAEFQDWLDQMAADTIASQPKPGQVWVLRKDEDDEDGLLRPLLRRALNTQDLPERVEIESVDYSWVSDLKVKVKMPDGSIEQIPVFEALYEHYRPTVWERLASPQQPSRTP